MTTPVEHAPSWKDTIAAAIPDHAHIDSKATTGWRAQWTTPTGLWTVERTNRIGHAPQVRVTGPGCLSELADPPADFVATLLRTFGAVA